MGWFSRKMKDPVRGNAQVVAASIPPRGVSGWSNCDLSLVVSAEGVEPHAVQQTSWLTPTSKWPYSGMTLPVTVDRADPDRVKIDWDEVPSGEDAAAAEAEQIAEAMRSGTDPTGGVPAEAAGIVSQLQELFPGAAVIVDEPVEINLDAGATDRVSQLERLAKLREDGMLTESEFQVEKARILGEA